MSVVKIYGAETSRYEYFRYNLEQFLERYHLDLEIEEIKDINKIIQDNVVSVPTLRINSHVDIVYNDEDGIDKFVDDSKNSILHEFAPELLTKILIPIDFSEGSLNAFKYGLELAKNVGGEIELLYVNHPSPLVVDGQVIVDEITVGNRKYNLLNIIDKTKKELAQQRGDSEFVTLKSTFLTGFAADEIINLSKDKDLVVMGTTGESMGKKLLGSVSLKVSANAHCSALFVPERAKFKGFDKMVYAYSPTSYDQKVIKDIADLARMYDSQVHLVHVDDGSDFEAYDISSYVSHMYEDVKFKCEEIEAESVSSGINHYAEQIKADVILLSKKKKNLLEKLIYKSQTKSTLMEAKIPIMVYHNDDHGCLCGGACRRKPDSNCNH